MSEMNTQEPAQAPTDEAPVETTTMFPAAQKPFSAMAICAIIFSVVFALVGLILGVIAYVRIPKLGQRGRGLALAAIIVAGVNMIAAFALNYTLLSNL